jgi:hypothetical protein
MTANVAVAQDRAGNLKPVPRLRYAPAPTADSGAYCRDPLSVGGGVSPVWLTGRALPERLAHLGDLEGKVLGRGSTLFGGISSMAPSRAHTPFIDHRTLNDGNSRPRAAGEGVKVERPREGL